MENIYLQPYTKRAEAKVFNFRPFLFTAVFFAVGVLIAYLCTYQDVSPWWCLSLLPIFVFGSFLFLDTAPIKRILLGALGLAVAFFIGYGALGVQMSSYQQGGCYNGDCVVFGRVVESVEQGDVAWISVDRVKVDGEKTTGKVRAYLRMEIGNKPALGDKVVLHGEIHDNTKEFNATRIDENYRHTIYVDSYTISGHSFDLFLSVKNRVKQVLYTGMDENSASVTMAVMSGDTSGMQAETLANMRYGGIAHIFAVSGLHIGALFGFCVWLIQKTKLKRLLGIYRFLFLAGVLLFYGGVCGFSASVTRAVLTCLILYATTLAGLGSDVLERIAISALVVMLLSPVSLFCVGFQLSFSACIGIALLKTPISASIYGVGKLFKKKQNIDIDMDMDSQNHPPSLGAQAVKKCVDFFSVTLSAQLATAPILLSAFGYLSGWGLLLNCIFVPVLSAIFSLLLLLCTVACILPLFFAKFVLSFPSALFTLLLLVFEIADFSKFCIQDVTLAKSAVVFYYLALLFITDKWNMAKPKKCVFALLCALLCAFVVFLTNCGGIP